MSTYPNQFARIGISDAAVLSRLSDCFSTIFFSPENNFYHQPPTAPAAACMVDTGTTDARTEGMADEVCKVIPREELCGLTGYWQDFSSATTEYLPDFGDKGLLYSG